MTFVPAPKAPVPVDQEIRQHHQQGDDNARDKVIDAESRYQQGHQQERDTKAGKIYREIPRELPSDIGRAGFESPYAIQSPAKQVHYNERKRHGDEVVQPGKLSKGVEQRYARAKAECTDDYKSNQFPGLRFRPLDQVFTLAMQYTNIRCLRMEVLHGIR